MFARSSWSEEFVRKFDRRAYRDAYVADQVRTAIALQIRALREQVERRWSQSELGRRMGGKPQSVVSRLEDPEYGRVTLQTLLDVASAFDLPLLVQIVGWDDWLQRMSDVSPAAFEKRSFDIDYLISRSRQRISSPISAQSQGSFVVASSTIPAGAITFAANTAEFQQIGTAVLPRAAVTGASQFGDASGARSVPFPTWTFSNFVPPPHPNDEALALRQMIAERDAEIANLRAQLAERPPSPQWPRNTPDFLNTDAGNAGVLVVGSISYAIETEAA